MQSFEDVLREFEDFLQTASYLEVLPFDGGMYGFLMRAFLSTSTQSYAVPHKNYMIR